MFKLWCKNKHDISTLSDEAFKAIENDILECFGGIRGLVQLALKPKRNLNYVQLLNLSNIINKQETEDKTITINNDISRYFSINSISENSLSKICEYINRKDEYHLKCANRTLFYCQFGTFHFTGLNSSGAAILRRKFNYFNNVNAKKLFNDNSLIAKCIEQIIYTNDTESMKKLINFSESRKNRMPLLTKTGLLCHLKHRILNEQSLCLDTLQLFTSLNWKSVRNFHQIFDDKLLAHFATILASNNSNKIEKTLVLIIIVHIIKNSPQFLCHLIKHNMHETVLNNVLKWTLNWDKMPNHKLLGLALYIIRFCLQHYDNNNKTKECLFNIVCSVIQSLYLYVTKEWKQYIYDGMKIKLNANSSVHIVQRIITDEKYFDKTSTFKQINNQNEKDDNKESQQIWLETIVKRYNNQKYKYFTTNLNDEELECVPEIPFVACFTSLIEILFKIKMNYKQNINLKELNIFIQVNYISDLIMSSNIYSAEVGEKNRKLFMWLLEMDCSNTLKLDIFNKSNYCLNINCGKLLHIIMQYGSNVLFDCLEKKKHFFVQSMTHETCERNSFCRGGNININKYETVLTIHLLQFIYDKINIDSQSGWSRQNLRDLLKQLIVPATIFDTKKMKTFITKNGHKVLIKLVRYLLEIYNSQFIYRMISYCIDLLVVIIKYSNDIIKKECCNCMMDILSHNLLMEHMKCTDSTKNDGILTFKNILSIPCSDIINKTMLYLNEKKGSVHDWYHHRSLRWIVRYIDEQSDSNQKDVIKLANIISYASDNIKYNINFKECQQIMNFIIDSLQIQYVGVNALYSPNKIYNYSRINIGRNKMLSARENGKLFCEALEFIDKFGKSYDVLNEKFKAKLLRIYYHKIKYNQDVIDKVKILLNEHYQIDVTAIENKTYS